jgi:hypothetical protein
MKNTKPAGFFVLGFLAVVLAGCFNPITAVPPQTGNPLTDPFTFEIVIGEDGSARTTVGPDSDRIKAGLYNIAQLVVMDTETKNIVCVAEDRKPNEASAAAKLGFNNITFGKTYAFLILLGHWERDYSSETDATYKYKETKSPTLLAAGFTSRLVTGSATITVSMWPLVVDTTFTTTDTDVAVASQTVQPSVTSYVPSKPSLFPVDWTVTWTIPHNTSTKAAAFTKLLEAQQVQTGASALPTSLSVKTKKTIVTGDGIMGTAGVTTTSTTTTGNTITLDIKSYTAGITQLGTSKAVNFNLEYVPFNITAGASWTSFNSSSNFDLNGEPPVWIIRNGINDEAQDANTSFAASANWKSGTNGNGAVSFGIAADTTGTALTISDESFYGPNTTDQPYIDFKTGGYTTGTAKVYYAVVQRDPGTPDVWTTAPECSEYTANLGSLVASSDTKHSKMVTLPGLASNNYDIYLVAQKGGKVSNVVGINTKKGSISIELPWGTE